MPSNDAPNKNAPEENVPEENAPERMARELPSSLSAYHEFVQGVLEKLQVLGWEKGVLFGIHMALEESISNAIRHGNKEDTQKKVLVECELSASRFWIKVCDEGEGYSPDKVPDCRDEDHIELPGGRGLALMRAYMTTVEHSECGCCVMMEKLLNEVPGKV